MTAESKTSVAARFAAFAFPSAADFSTLVDSYTDASDTLEAVATAARAGSKGLVYVSGASAVSFYSGATVGLRMLNTATTAAAQGALGGGTAGIGLFEASTTAAAQQAAGGGAVGRQIFETATTAASQSILAIPSIATTAEALAGTSNLVAISPHISAFLNAMPKAWVNFDGISSTSVRSAFNVSTVVRNNTGDYSIVFTNAMASAGFTYLVTADQSAGATNNAPRNPNHVEATAGGLRFRMTDSTPTANDCEVINVVFWGTRA